MENTEILKELDTLKTELNGRINSFIKKYEDSIKPKIEIGKWYFKKAKHADLSWLFLVEKVGVTIHTKSCFVFHLDDGRFYYHDTDYTISIEGNERLATPQEVQEALTKEAVKKYQGKYFKPTNGKNKVEFRAGFIGYDVSENKLLSNNYSVFQNGI